MRRSTRSAMWLSIAFGFLALGSLWLVFRLPRATAQGNCTPPASGLVAWWQGNGAANDIFGGNHGALRNGTTFTTGVAGQAFSFDGTDDDVAVPASVALDVGAGNGLTIEAWLNPVHVLLAQSFVEWHTNTNFGAHFDLFGGAGRLHANLVDSGGGWHQLSSDTGILTPGTFQHIALTYDKTTGLGRLYRNGVIVAEANLGVFRPQTTYDLFIGRPLPRDVGPLQGALDEVTLYHRALTTAEIQAVFNAGAAGKCPPTGGPCPIVSGLSPNAGGVGTQVTIIGANFTGVTSVRFANNVSATFTVVSHTQITANVPAGGVTGPLTLSKPGCPDVPTPNFTVLSPSALNVYVMKTGHFTSDQAVLNALAACGSVPVEGVPVNEWNGTQANLNLFSAVVLLNSFNYAAGSMPTAGQTALLNYVSGGKGVVTGEWLLYNGGGYATLSPMLPATYFSFNSAVATTYTQVSANAVINAGLPSFFTFPLNGNTGGSESRLSAKPGATTFYGSSNSTGGGLIGGTYGTGRVLSFSTLLTHTELSDANYSRLLCNAVQWVGTGACPAITLSPATLSAGTAGMDYNQSIAASGGTGPHTFSVSAGALPAGLTLNATTGLLAGFTANASTFNFTLRATAANGCTGERAYTLVVHPLVWFETMPPAPTANDNVSLRIFGDWPNNCVPGNPQLTRTGNQILIATTNPGQFCSQVITPWTQTLPAGQLPAGVYQVTVTFNGTSISSHSFPVTPATCAYALTPSGQTFPSEGGTGTVNVAAPAGCNWTATSGCPWAGITAGSAGSGNGTVNYTVQANAAATPRTCTLSIAGQSFPLTQAGTTGGALIIDGTDANEHGTVSGGVNLNGWLYMQKALENLAGQVSSGTAKVVVDLGASTGKARDAINSAFNLSTLPGNGWTITHVDGASAITAWLNNLAPTNTGILYLTTYNHITGDLAPDEMAAINAGAAAIAAYVNRVNDPTRGGALFAMGESNTTANTGAWGWLQTVVPGLTVTDVGTGGIGTDITLTPDGMLALPGLTNAVMAGADPWHDYFGGNLGNLKVLGTAPDAGSVTRNVILGGTSVSIARADLSLSKTDAPDPVAAGANLSYTITVANTVPDAAQNVLVADNLPAALSFVSCAATGGGVCGGTGNNRTVSFASLASGASAVITLIATVNNGTAGGTTINNTATVGAQTFDPNAGNNAATAATLVSQIGCLSVALSNTLTGAPGGSLNVPLTVPSLSGSGVVAYDFTLLFDPAMLALQTPPVESAGTLSSGMTITPNTSTPGRLVISAFSTTPLSGAGTLLILKFNLLGAPGACSDLTWQSFRFNEGTPCAAPINGRVCVTQTFSLAGVVAYCVAPAKKVPGVLVSTNTAPPVTSITDSQGNYALAGLGGGAVTVTPAKTGEVSGITSFDASLVAQCVAGLRTCTACEQAAGDASNNGSLSSFDASLIAQYAAGIPNASSVAGTWKFVPPNRTYPKLNGNLTNQNFDAVLVGDVSGNWQPGGSRPTPSTPVAQVPVSLPHLSGNAGAQLTVPVTIGDLTGLGVTAYDLEVVFNPAIVQLQDPPVAAAGTLSSGLTLTPNPLAGRLRVSAFGVTALSGSGTLLQLKFTLTGAAGASTPLTWQSLVLNEEMQTQTSPGSLSINTGAAGLEADVAPRPSGSGAVNVADYVQVGRFAIGLDTAAAGGEFQRADCAPRATLGDGQITVADYVQAGRYAVGLDPATPAAGPLARRVASPSEDAFNWQRKDTLFIVPRVLRLASAAIELPSGQLAVAVELDAQGGEHALSFTLRFDAAAWRYHGLVRGADTAAAGVLVHTQPAAQGEVGLLLALPPNAELAAGARQVLLLVFTPLQNTADVRDWQLGDGVTALALVDAHANPLPIQTRR